MKSLAFFALSAVITLSVTSGCSYVRPYKIEINQGNYVTQDAVDKLKVGMTRSQVRTVLGPPLIESAFHTNRWEYHFSLERRGQPITKHQVSVFFEGEGLKSWEAKALPKEPVIDKDTTVAVTAEKDGEGVLSRLRDWWKK
jgi:outer membrane protein assembly factor BamE